MGRSAKFVVAVAVVACCVWGFFAPYLTVESMRRAAQRGDAEALASHVDFPAVRDSLKRQLAARVNARIGGSPLERLGAGLANAIASPAIDAMVSPQSLALLFAGRDLGDDVRAFAAPAPPTDDGATADGGIRIDDARMTMGYDDLSTFTVEIETGSAGDPPTRLIFRRRQLVRWILTDVVLPASAERPR